MPKRKKQKRVQYRYIPERSDAGVPMYRLLHDLVDAHHEEIRDARIALAWNLSWKPDVDGRVTLGQCKKVSDLPREIFDGRGQPYDFIIVLRQEFWTDPQVTDHQRRALLDHELCHASVRLDEAGDPQVDERQRLVYRMRRHDLEEFACIVERYGCYKHDLEQFALALDRARKRVAPDEFVGYTSLRDELAALGVSVSLDVIRTWNDAQRREARTWVVLKSDAPLHAGALPPHVAAAVTQPR